jgi:hypothetical protein
MKHLDKTLVAAAAALQAHEDNVAEAAERFAAGKLDEKTLDRAIKERDAASARVKALEAGQKAAQHRDAKAEKAARFDARKAAKTQSENLLEELEACAADCDSAINTLVNVAGRYSELNQQVFRTAATVGVMDNHRHYLLDLRAIDTVLATRLAESGLYQQLNLVHINPAARASEDVAGYTKKNTKRMLSHLNAAIQKAEAEYAS